MTLRHLKIFVAVCDCKTVTAAAQKLYLAQPAVSLAVAELEEYYGVRLFDRLSRRLYLTGAGERFLDYARHITALFEELETGIKSWESAGPLRVGSSMTIGARFMPQAVRAFAELHPQVAVHLTVENSQNVERKVVENQLDFAFIEGSPHFEQLLCEPFERDEMVLLCSGADPLAGREELLPEELPTLPFLLREKGSGTRDLFDSALAARELVIQPIWESGSVEALISAAEAGIGVTILPRRMAQQAVEAGRLAIIPIKGLTFGRDLQIIHHRSKYLTQPALDFLALCRSLVARGDPPVTESGVCGKL